MPGKSHGQRSLWATVHEVTKSRTWLSDFTYRCVDVPHCHFNLKLINHMWWWASLHMLICCKYAFFCEVLILICFSPPFWQTIWLFLLSLKNALYILDTILLSVIFYKHFLPVSSLSFCSLNNAIHRHFLSYYSTKVSCCIVVLSHSVMSDTLRPHGLSPTRNFIVLYFTFKYEIILS